MSQLFCFQGIKRKNWQCKSIFSNLSSETEALISLCEHFYNWTALQISEGDASIQRKICQN